MPTTPALIQLLQNLVQQSSISGQEGGALEVAEAAMQAAGFDTVTRDATGNLLGAIQGQKPGGKILFDAHIDVVKVTTPEAWQRSPFSGEYSDGRVWGRGSTDNKGSLAAMIAGLGSLPRQEICGMLYLVASVGEEIWEGVGLAQVVDSIHPDCVIVGEPTNLRLGISQRGRARLVFRVSGLAGHSSADDQTGNAIYRMGHLIERLAQHRLPSGTPLGSGIQAPIELISNPYPSTSILPVTCSLTIDRRLVLGETLEGVVADYRSVLAGLPSSRVDIDTVAYTSYTGQSFHLADFHPAWSTPRDSPLVQACLRGLASAQIETGVYAVPYCTNASYSAGQIGIPAVVFGPGDIAQAHAIDEYLDTAELQRAAQGYAALAREICQGAGQ